MATTARWLYPNRILYVETTEILTIDEIKEGHRRHIEMMDALRQVEPVHYIFDTTHMESGPTNFLEVQRAGRAFYRHPKLGWSVGVGESAIVRLVTTSIAKILGLPYKPLADIDGVISFFHELHEDFQSMTVHDLTAHEIVYQIGSEVTTS